MTALKLAKANKLLRSSIVMLERKGRKDKSPIWKEAARYLASGTATWPEVNVGHLSRIGDAAAVFVPGKVLGTGEVAKKLNVGAFSFSASAKSKIEAAGGKTFTVEEFVKKYPEGSGVALVK
ncbi:MAG TPA: 50S ribosomal protein L18e [Nitrososphaerales archaeon]|nr:50S ribosomal protein L18e [Nitrososphaerales archaeon]HUK74234.1 50S ribosomal protein L18e [Nitrososphaerales archaeon]